MKTKDKIKALLDFTLRNRRTGTSSIIEKVSQDNDIYIIVAYEENKKEFSGSCVTIEDFKNIQGKTPKPYLIDNHALRLILIESESEIIRLEHEIYNLNHKLNKIKGIIDKL